MNAVQASITSSLNNIGKGFAACLTINNWDNCDNLQKIDVACAGCGTPVSNGTKSSLCVDVARRVGGAEYKGCLESSGGVPLVVGNWPIPCSNLQMIYPCSGGTLGSPSKTCAGVGCAASTAAPTSCTGNTAVTHNCSTANPDGVSNGTAFTGTCAAGQCT